MDQAQRDRELSRLARAYGYTGIPRQLDAGWRRSLQIFNASFRNNAAENTGLRYYDVQWPQHILNPWSGEFRFRFLPDRGVSAVLNPETLGGLEANLRRMLTNARNYVIGRAHLKGTDYVQFKLWSGPGHHTISSHVRTLYQLTTNNFLAKVMESLNSAEEIDLTTTWFVITYFRRPAGGAYPVKGSMTVEKWIQSKKKTVCVVNSKDTNDCFWQCLAIGLDGDQFPELYRTRTNAQQLRIRRGAFYRHFLQENGMEFEHPTKVMTDEIVQVEEALEVSIDIFRAYDLRRIRKSTKVFPKKITLLEVAEYGGSPCVHYHFVKQDKLGSLFGRRKFCNLCNRSYDNVRHKCIVKCYGCKRDNCLGKNHTLEQFTAYCNDCHRKFYDGACLAAHLHSCLERVLCEICNVVYNAKDDKQEAHQCFRVKCGNCRRILDTREAHQCYMAIDHVNVDKPRPAPSLFFYDYECCFNAQLDHKVALVVVIDPADRCHVFESNDRFVDYVLEQADCVFIAHNAARYDGHFVKRLLLERGVMSSDVVNGCSLMQMHLEVQNIRFIDSCKFIPMPLRNFPKTFAIPNLTKGFFPYRFFTEERLHYKGPMPGVEWFDFEKMKPAERKEAERWYARHKEDNIDLFAMCKEYCIDDVKLLAAGCRIFEENFMDVTVQQFSPFHKITIAGVCMKIFKAFYLIPYTVGIYNPNFEVNAKWMAWVKKRRVVQKEETLGLTVTGDPERGKEGFRECLPSGCMRCYNRFTQHPISYQPMHTHNARTEAFFKEQGVTKIVRECNWKTSVPIVTGLNIRDALYGGRTEVFWEKCVGEEIGYVDFTSLYPYVNYGVDAHQYVGHDYFYPIGHPVIRKPHELTLQVLENSFGFAKVRVQAPLNLHIPFLPHRRDGKLMFELGEFVGTYTTVELVKARQLGYRVVDIYAIVHFPKKSSTLFREYMQEFYGQKIEATGWRKLGLTSPEERELYLQEVERRYGITGLTMQEECNEGMYYISKLCLNSLWGKFAQRERFSQTKDVFTEEECFALLEDDQYDVSNVFLHNVDARSVTYTTKKGFDKPGETNVAIAAYTTAYGRMCLYSLMELLGPQRILYCDTDSVIYRKGEGCPELPIGTFLGQLTDELDGDTIVEFAATGPKSYAYRTRGGKETVKMKGFTLGEHTKERVHLKRLLEIVEGTPEEHEMVPGLVFDIGRDHQIRTRAGAEKKFRRTQNKRRRVENGENITSLPHIFHS